MAVKYIRLLAYEDIKRIKMGRFSQIRQRKHFSIETMVEKYENIYLDMHSSS